MDHNIIKSISVTTVAYRMYGPAGVLWIDAVPFYGILGVAEMLQLLPELLPPRERKRPRDSEGTVFDEPLGWMKADSSATLARAMTTMATLPIGISQIDDEIQMDFLPWSQTRARRQTLELVPSKLGAIAHEAKAAGRVSPALLARFQQAKHEAMSLTSMHAVPRNKALSDLADFFRSGAFRVSLTLHRVMLERSMDHGCSSTNPLKSENENRIP